MQTKPTAASPPPTPEDERMIVMRREAEAFMCGQYNNVHWSAVRDYKHFNGDDVADLIAQFALNVLDLKEQSARQRESAARAEADAEIERYREALERIADHDSDIYHLATLVDSKGNMTKSYRTAYEALNLACKVASAALGDTEGR
jgi:hypothetical protein